MKERTSYHSKVQEMKKISTLLLRATSKKDYKTEINSPLLSDVISPLSRINHKPIYSTTVWQNQMNWNRITVKTFESFLSYLGIFLYPIIRLYLLHIINFNYAAIKCYSTKDYSIFNIYLILRRFQYIFCLDKIQSN